MACWNGLQPLFRQSAFWNDGYYARELATLHGERLRHSAATAISSVGQPIKSRIEFKIVQVWFGLNREDLLAMNIWQG